MFYLLKCFLFTVTMEITEIKLLVESELGLGYRSQLVGVDDQALVHGLPLLLRVVGILLVLFCQIGRQLVAVNLVLAWRVTDVGVERQVDAVSRGGHGQPLDSRVFLRHIVSDLQDVGFHVNWHVDRPVAALPLAVAGVLGPGEVGVKHLANFGRTNLLVRL